MSSTKIFEEYIDNLKSKASKNELPNNNALLYTITTDIAKTLELKKSILKGKHALSEVMLTLIITISYGLSNLQTIDVITIVLSIIFLLKLQWDSFKTYITDFLPYFVAQQTLLGKDVKFLNNKDEPHS